MRCGTSLPSDELSDGTDVDSDAGDALDSDADSDPPSP